MIPTALPLLRSCAGNSAYRIPILYLFSTGRKLLSSRFFTFAFAVRPLSAFVFVLLLAVSPSLLLAQNPKALRYDIRMLTGAAMSGRGYVDKGSEKAARFLVKRLKEAGVVPATEDSGYLQGYSFSVNTFPLPFSLKINGKELRPGVDYLIDARSHPFESSQKKVSRLDVRRIFEKAPSGTARREALSANGGIAFWKNADTVTKSTFLRNLPPDSLAAGLYLVPVKGKMTWTARTSRLAGGATVVYIQDSILPRKVRKAEVRLPSKFVPNSRQYNVCGMVRGTEVPDSFIVFTAHYDHLGEMGKGTVFPGANDNASGTAMVLDLARYFAQKPPRYSVLFLFFSGEEAGLIGSKYYTENPLKPLENIQFLINLDMVGECADGATVVNGTLHPEAFARLEYLNNEARFLPKLNKRGEAANSDHYHFTQAGVPSFFLYGNGGKGHYHDVFDTAEALSLTNTQDLQLLLIRFVAGF